MEITTKNLPLQFTVVVLVLITVAYSEIVPICQQLDACKCKYNNNDSIIDLWPLTMNNHKPAFPDVLGANSSKYSFNPCSPFDEATCKDSTICELTNGTSTKLANTTTSFYMLGQYVALRYSYEDYISEVVLICNEYQTAPIFDATGMAQGRRNYTFALISKHCCSYQAQNKPSKTGLSAGGVILIVFFVILFLYLLIGVLDQKFRRKATGLELIPHWDFWSQLPGLIGDGFGYVIMCGCLGRNRRTYDEV